MQRERDRPTFHAETVSAVAHDLRGRLNAIVLAIGALESERIVGDKRVRSAATARRAIADADRLLVDLVTIAHLEEGTLHLDATPISARVLLDEACRARAAAATAIGAALHIDVRADVVARADHHHVVYALCKLLDDAIEYAPATSEIVLAARRVAGSAELVVRDRGPDVVFDADAFERSDRRRGLVLGLAIVRGIARAHGGDARCEPARGGGRELVIALPDL